MINKNFKIIRKLRWEEVFLFWYNCEGLNPHWIKTAKKHGFASWAEWRLNSCINAFKCLEINWGLYEALDLQKEILQLFGAPYKTFMDRYCGGKKIGKISNLAKCSEVKKNEIIKNMADNFLENETIICLEVGGRLYVIEGMHRCCALAIMINEGKKLPEKLKFAIGISPLKKLPVI